MNTRWTSFLAMALSLAAGCSDPAAETDPELAYSSDRDVGTYQYFFLDSYRPLIVDDHRAADLRGELWIYDADGGVPEHIDAFVMEPRPDSVIVTESFPIEYSATDPVAIGVSGTDAEFRLMVVAVDGWVARTDNRRETFDCVELTPDGARLTAWTHDGKDARFVDWETLEAHGEPQILVLPLRTKDGTATGDDGQRLVGYGLDGDCGGDD